MAIRWPDEHLLSKADRKNLDLFRATSASMELAADGHAWVLEATSWVDEFPVRMIWRNEEVRRVCFTLEDTGIWRLVPYDTAPAQPNPCDPLSPMGNPDFSSDTSICRRRRTCPRG